jgi:hypothetical protein
MEVVSVTDREEQEMERRKLAGLSDQNITISGRLDGRFTATGPAYFPTAQPARVTYRRPEGRWQRIKYWLRRHGMRWLKIRYVTYSVDATVGPRHGETPPIKPIGSITRGKEVQ